VTSPREAHSREEGRGHRSRTGAALHQAVSLEYGHILVIKLRGRGRPDRDEDGAAIAKRSMSDSTAPNSVSPGQSFAPDTVPCGPHTPPHRTPPRGYVIPPEPSGEVAVLEESERWIERVSPCESGGYSLPPSRRGNSTASHFHEPPASPVAGNAAARSPGSRRRRTTCTST